MTLYRIDIAEETFFVEICEEQTEFLDWLKNHGALKENFSSEEIVFENLF